MKLYHGSNVFINNPDFLFSKPYKDFGLGFSCPTLTNRHTVLLSRKHARQMVSL